MNTLIEFPDDVELGWSRSLNLLQYDSGYIVLASQPAADGEGHTLYGQILDNDGSVRGEPTLLLSGGYDRNVAQDAIIDGDFLRIASERGTRDSDREPITTSYKINGGRFANKSETPLTDTDPFKDLVDFNDDGYTIDRAFVRPIGEDSAGLGVFNTDGEAVFTRYVKLEDIDGDDRVSISEPQIAIGKDGSAKWYFVSSDKVVYSAELRDDLTIKTKEEARFDQVSDRGVFKSTTYQVTDSGVFQSETWSEATDDGGVQEFSEIAFIAHGDKTPVVTQIENPFSREDMETQITSGIVFSGDPEGIRKAPDEPRTFDVFIRDDIGTRIVKTSEPGITAAITRVQEQGLYKPNGTELFTSSSDQSGTLESYTVVTLFDENGAQIGEPGFLDTDPETVSQFGTPMRTAQFEQLESGDWAVISSGVDQLVHISIFDPVDVAGAERPPLDPVPDPDPDPGMDPDANPIEPEIIRGTQGDDLIYGRGSDAIIYGYQGNDELRGGAGDDDMRAGSGDDELRGNKGNDTLKGNGGNDSLRGDAGDDRLSGGNGDDRVRGNDGDDYASGDAGDDIIWGGKGFDQIFGGAGADVLDGGKDDDLLDGGADDDVLIGGRGDDTFRFDAGDGSDVIKDFGKGADKIQLAGYDGDGLEGLLLSQEDSTAIIEWEGTRIALEKTDIHDLTEDVFV